MLERVGWYATLIFASWPWSSSSPRSLPPDPWPRQVGLRPLASS